MTGFREVATAPYEAPMSRGAFLHWVQGRAERYELQAGRVMQQMTGGTLHHNDLAENIADALRRRLDRKLWAVTTHNTAVAVPGDGSADTVRFPDVVVRRRGDPPTALVIETPVVLFEVLSPSTSATDLAVKPGEYLAIPSLLAFGIASQDEPRLVIWTRTPTGSLPPSPQALTAPRDRIEISELGIKIPLSEIYDGMASFPTAD